MFLYVVMAILRARHLPPPDRFEFTRVFFIPESTCHITDLDQAVAFGAGIVTIVVSLCGAISERVPARMRTWGQFEDWRKSRVDFIEANGTDERLSGRLKEHLQRLDEKVKGLLEAPERKILDKAWRRSKRKKVEDAERVIGLLKESGFL
ncbi:hypothetical protein K491DRAFT_710112 [Lophiostoma macrostomum CBS 122681]|uniref:Uncharacterized protein n=1 Tax=Lophiostoma macrostomum CBS 122681 TaxID=1314788 RepID=A0A6A6TSL8_9PLEO|nr:hypothetical protein K491DRAFT_710112 [Lophiostoma macrostomum CBS 122681]